MLKIGVLGAGHLGKIHLKLIKEISAYQLCGFFDPDNDTAEKVSNELKIKKFNSLDELIDAVDVIDIVTPTLSHYECAEASIKKGKHLFIEKPLAYSIKEAEELVKMVKVAGIKAQVGHVERFNPAFIAAQETVLKPMFIESTRIAQYNPRGNDVSVVLDLMIHDIDIILSLVDSKVKQINASGVSIISDSPDIANARVEFENGYVANLTASRASLKNERKMRLFQKNSYITINFLDKKVAVYKIHELQGESTDPFSFVIDPGNGKKKKEIIYSTPKVPEINSIKHELTLFSESILNDTTPEVTIDDGFRSLKLAYEILEEINKSQEKVNLK
ncbi:MAG: Gfo/Idh/MocA family oxidoreductase [Bacteroidota bacterium]|nr:Gfo/Idh/MocA family oxidoreductase [Bacteroidota bacterium]